MNAPNDGRTWVACAYLRSGVVRVCRQQVGRVRAHVDQNGLTLVGAGYCGVAAAVVGCGDGGGPTYKLIREPVFWTLGAVSAVFNAVFWS